MSDATDALRRLAHDVGKYVARTARNLPPGRPAAPLHAMLVADLYGAPGAPGPLAVFDALSKGIDEPAVEAARERLRAIGGLEDDVRRGDGAAIERAAALALEVDELLHARIREMAR